MPAAATDEVALEAKDVTGGPLKGVSFQLKRGEVLGVAGLLGSGRSELLKMAFGAYPIRAGTFELDGKPVKFRHIGQAMDAGIAYVPEDRGTEASFPDLTLSENVSAAMVDRYWKNLRLRKRAGRRRRPGLDQPSSSSGPRRSARRWARCRAATSRRWCSPAGCGASPRCCCSTSPPTASTSAPAPRSTSWSARPSRRAARSLLVSSDFEELATVADRVIVLANGRVSAELNAPDIEPARLTELAFSTQEIAS